jgi:hypothetical protein
VEDNVVKDSHPGYPWNKLAHDNGSVLNGYGNLIWDEVAKRFNNILHAGDMLFEMSPEQLVQRGLCDPVKVFIKKEPHSLKKISEGRFRIISSVSLVDQIVTRLMCMRQNKAEISEWQSCPSAPGMGLNDDGLAVIWETASYFAEHGEVCETDISGWDWSVQQWELDLDAQIRAELMGCEPDGIMAHFLKAHAYIVGHSVYALPDGELLAQTVAGGQLSGDYNTSSTNSRCRVVATLAARARAEQEETPLGKFPRLGIKAMGDDSFEIWFEGLEEGLEEIGHSVKMCVKRPGLENFEFCSQVFEKSGVAYPVDFSKTLFRFLSHNPADPKYPEYRAQLLYYFRHLPLDTLQVITRLADARVERAQTLAGTI